MAVDRSIVKGFLTGPDFAGSYCGVAAMCINPDGIEVDYQGVPLSGNDAYSGTVVHHRLVGLDDPPSAEDPAKGLFQKYSVYFPILSAGRGFSFLVKRLVVTSEEDGLVRCRGRGKTPGTRKPCHWELTIEPETAYMVREAKCILDETGTTAYVVENEGTKWFEGGPLPESARFRRASDIYEITEIAFRGLASAADTEVLRNAHEALRGTYPTWTHVTDLRKDAAVKYYVVGDVAPAPKSKGKSR